MWNGFSKPNPFPKSVFENVAYGLKVNGITDKKFIANRVEETLKAAALFDEVKDKLNKSASNYRVATAKIMYCKSFSYRAFHNFNGRTGFCTDPISTSKIEELIHQSKNIQLLLLHTICNKLHELVIKQAFMLGELIEYNDTKKCS